jgi:hypothetical protein
MCFRFVILISAALGLDQQSLMALGLGMDVKSINALQQQQQLQAEHQAKQLAQMMSGNLDPKYLAQLGLGGGAQYGAQTSMDKLFPKKEEYKQHRSTPPPSKAHLDEGSSQAEKDYSSPKADDDMKAEITEITSENEAEELASAEKGKESPKPSQANPESPVKPGSTTTSVKGDKPETDAIDETKSVNENRSERALSPRPGSSKAGTPRPEHSSSRPPSQCQTPKLSQQMDPQAMMALKSLSNVDAKSLQASGLDANILRQLGIQPPQASPRHSQPSSSNPYKGIPGMEALDTETLKALASGDAAAIQKIMNSSAAASYGMATSQASAYQNQFLGGIDPRMLGGLDERTLMALAASGGLGGGIDPKMFGMPQQNMGKQQNFDNQQLKALGIDMQTLQLMQQQEQLLKQQQLAQQMSMFGMGGMDPKTMQMLGASAGIDPKLLQGMSGLDQQTQQLMAQQQAALGILGM